MKFRSDISISLVLLGILAMGSSCSKYLPHNRETLTDDAAFTQSTYQPVLGRSTLYNTFNAGNSTQPLNFQIINPRTRSGEPAPELTDVFPVKVWNEEYTGNEKSLAEIEAKRSIEMHHLFEIRPHSGQFVMWSEAKSSFLRSLPDSGYIFDVELSNSGGRKYFRDFQLMPYRERPYEPSNLDPVTGQATNPNVYPTIVNNIYGEKSNQQITGGSIAVFFNKVGEGNSLTFKFEDTLHNPIDPHKFALTDWANLVHGFNMQMNNDSITYQVAYPIPLTNLKTKYTTVDGQKAHVLFQWARQGFGNQRILSQLGLDFNIYEKGDWQIIFWFKRDNPKFDND